MTGGAGYVLSREAVRRFVAGHSDPGICRPGEEGPEDVEMSRCLQRLGASFIDTRDKYGRY
jgi:glycoprotein-N-acetylgalactosamine 3-beta-galactosyltransferase